MVQRECVSENYPGPEFSRPAVWRRRSQCSRGPGIRKGDFSALNHIRLTETKELQFRGELFNVLNHTNFRLPVIAIESAPFGHLQSDVSPRVIQGALKFLF